MKTMCPPSYYHNHFVATHALGHMMYGLYMLFIYIYIYMNLLPLRFNSCPYLLLIT